jgi:hypothetical protein
MAITDMDKSNPYPSVTSELSFQKLITDMNIQQQQEDVSLPFYFICLLHLANEKVNMIYH